MDTTVTLSASVFPAGTTVKVYTAAAYAASGAGAAEIDSQTTAANGTTVVSVNYGVGYIAVGAGKTAKFFAQDPATLGTTAQAVQAIADDLDDLTTLVGGVAVAGGTATVTGATLDIVTGLATVTALSATLAEAPGAGAGDVFSVSAAPHATPGTITVSIWQDDATAATEDTDVQWLAIGTR